MTDAQPEKLIQPIEPDRLASPWVVVAASVQGTRHIQATLPCQDAHAYRAFSDSILIAAVADGLGTALFAQAGARLAVDCAVSSIEQALMQAIPCDESAWNQLIRDCFLAARARLEEEAQASQAALRDYSTTLVLVVITGEWLVTGQIGDGAVVALLDEGELIMASSPQNEEYVNVTFPLTMPDMIDIAQFKACPAKVKALALMTDGMQHVSIRSVDHTPHPPFFEPLFRQLPSVKDTHKASLNLAEFMASPAISAHTDDDKTLVLIGQRRA